MYLSGVLVAHLRACGILTFGNEFESNGRSTVRTLRSNRFVIEEFVLILREPHELEALGTATDLRCHGIPRTLGPFDL
jgi:hypothetical protein